MKAKLYDVVKTKVKLSQDRLIEGDNDLDIGSKGTVIEVFENPTEGYDVEFVNEDGNTIGICNLKPEEFNLVNRE